MIGKIPQFIFARFLAVGLKVKPNLGKSTLISEKLGYSMVIVLAVVLALIPGLLLATPTVTLNLANTTGTAGSQLAGVTLIYNDSNYYQGQYLEIMTEPIGTTTAQACGSTNQYLLVDTNSGSGTPFGPTNCTQADTSANGWNTSYSFTTATPVTQVFNVTIPSTFTPGTYNLVAVVGENYMQTCTGTNGPGYAHASFTVASPNTSTPTPSLTPTWTPGGPTYTFTPTFTITNTPTKTNTPTVTNSPTITNTPSNAVENLKTSVFYSTLQAAAAAASGTVTFQIFSNTTETLPVTLATGDCVTAASPVTMFLNSATWDVYGPGNNSYFLTFYNVNFYHGVVGTPKAITSQFFANFTNDPVTFVGCTFESAASDNLFVDSASTDKLYFDRCAFIGHGTASGVLSNNGNYSPTFHNCLFVDCLNYGWWEEQDNGGTLPIFANCDFVNNTAGITATGSNGAAAITNCAFFDSGADFVGSVSTSWTLVNCVYASTPSASYIKTITSSYISTAAKEFFNSLSGSENLNINAGATCVGRGANLSGTFTDDYTGATRSSWDIGAYAFNSVYATATANANGTATANANATATQNAINSQTPTPTVTRTATLTFTQTATLTFTQTQTPTDSSTNTLTDTPTDTTTDTPTDTPTITDTPTDSPTNTPATTDTPTYTPSPTDSPTVTSTSTLTPNPQGSCGYLADGGGVVPPLASGVDGNGTTYIYATVLNAGEADFTVIVPSSGAYKMTATAGSPLYSMDVTGHVGGTSTRYWNLNAGEYVVELDRPVHQLRFVLLQPGESLRQFHANRHAHSNQHGDTDWHPTCRNGHAQPHAWHRFA